MAQSNKPISPLRRRMIEDMSMRKLSPKSHTAYIRAVKNFARFVRRSQDTSSPEDLRRFQLHMVSSGVSRISINATITALRFFFEVTLERPEAMKKMSTVRVGCIWCRTVSKSSSRRYMFPVASKTC